jgi:hypothetical protein
VKILCIGHRVNYNHPNDNEKKVRRVQPKKPIYGETNNIEIVCFVKYQCDKESTDNIKEIYCKLPKKRQLAGQMESNNTARQQKPDNP